MTNSCSNLSRNIFSLVATHLLSFGLLSSYIPNAGRARKHKITNIATSVCFVDFDNIAVGFIHKGGPTGLVGLAGYDPATLRLKDV